MHTLSDGHTKKTRLKELNSTSIGIVGNGSWGTALAKILTDNGNQVRWWVRNKEAVAYLERRGHNPHYLTSVSFSRGTILPTNDLADVLHHCDIVVVAIPSAYAQGVIQSVDPGLYRGKTLISAIKGILPDCNLLLNDFLTSELDLDRNNYIAITGPCHAEEVAEERLSYLTFSGLNDSLTAEVAGLFNNSYIRTNTNHDLWGVQLAAVLKNIYAIGAGMARALDYGDNFLSVYITNCYREMYHFLVDHFNKVNPLDRMPDFHTSAYLGDLLVTCYSLHSRNRTFGSMIGKGYSVKAATLEMNMVAEGYYGARGMHHTAHQYAIDIPIASLIYEVLWNHLSPSDAFIQIEQLLS